MEFNHAETVVYKALGQDEKFMVDLKAKMKTLIKNALLGDRAKISMIAEDIVFNFSYDELIVLSSILLKDKIKTGLEEMTGKKSDNLNTIKSMIDEIIKRDKNRGEDDII